MRRWIWCVALVAATVGPASVSSQSPGPRVKDSIVGIDKLKHFLLSGFVESVTFASLQAVGANRSASLTGALGAAATISIGREVHDRRTSGLFSFGDLVWDALGAGAAMLILTRIGR